MIGLATKALLVSAFVMASPAAVETSIESCVAGDPDTSISVPIGGVIELTSLGNFSLPANVSPQASMIQCDRASIVPERNDYKVLIAGFPLIIATEDGRVAALEISEHRVQFRTIEGRFSDTEIPAISAYLDFAQPLLDARGDGT